MVGGGGVGHQAFGSDLGKARERRTGLLWLVGIAAEKGEWALYTAFTATPPPPTQMYGMCALTLSIWQAHKQLKQLAISWVFTLLFCTYQATILYLLKKGGGSFHYSCGKLSLLVLHDTTIMKQIIINI